MIHPSRPRLDIPRRRAFWPSLLIVLLLAILGSGCGGTRGPRSPMIPPPINPAADALTTGLLRLKTMELQTPVREDYVLGPGDLLSIVMIGRPELFGTVQGQPENKLEIRLTENPTIVLPYIGAITAHGKTPYGLQEEIRAAYSAIIKDPIPIVTVLEYHYNQVAVLGSVKAPGRYTLEAGDTVLDAIFKAQGLTLGGQTGNLPPAAILKIYREKVPLSQKVGLSMEDLMERFTVDGAVEPREEIIIPLDEFLLGGNLQYNVPLIPNDIIFVPPAGTVSVHGDVRGPRAVFLGPGIRTLAQVITETGGLRYRAASRVEIVRANPDGTTSSYFKNARRVMSRKEADFQLQDNDQVFVYRHPWRNVLSTIGDIFRATATTGVNATYSPV